MPALLAAALLPLAGCERERSLDPWDDEAYLSGSSVLDRALDMAQAPKGHHYETVLCVSRDRPRARFTCRTVAHTASSFDLHVLDSGIVLTAQLNLAEWGLLAEGGRHVYALTSPDLERFGTRLWPVDRTASPMLTDAAVEILPGGARRLVYVSGAADAAGEHRVKAAVAEGDRWVEVATPIFSGERIVDPSTCFSGGRYHLFATDSTRSGILHAVGETPWAYTRDEAFSWPGAQVPYCSVQDGELTVLAQRGGGWEPPAIRTLRDDGSFAEATALWEPGAYPDLPSCTSPVMGVFRSRRVLFCAVHR